MRRHFLRWWVAFTGILVGTTILVAFGFLGVVNRADVTKISFAIYVVFLLSSIRIGWAIQKYPRLDPCSTIRFSSLAVSIMPVMGMIGTVIGFIIVLGDKFRQIDVSNVPSMQAALIPMAAGLGSALYTTATGLVCALFLMMQLFILEEMVEDARK